MICVLTISGLLRIEGVFAELHGGQLQIKDDEAETLVWFNLNKVVCWWYDDKTEVEIE